MAKTKAAGSKARQGSNVAGKRLGIKVFGGQTVKPGQIIVRQRGKTFLPGDNVDMGKDYTLYSLADGTVQFKYKNKTKKQVNVLRS